MENKPDMASELLNIIDEETRELFGQEEARELRENVNKRLKNKELDPIE